MEVSEYFANPLETFLRGMETEEYDGYGHHPYSLETFLRGMETAVFAEPAGRAPLP